METDAGQMHKVLPDREDREKKRTQGRDGDVWIRSMSWCECASHNPAGMMKIRPCKNPGHVENWTRETTMCRHRNMYRDRQMRR